MSKKITELKTEWQKCHLKEGDTYGGIPIPREWIKDGKLIPRDQRPKRHRNP